VNRNRFSDEKLNVTDDEVNQLIGLDPHYGPERLAPDICCADDGTVRANFRLNGAGRRYLIEDGSFISKGVEVFCVLAPA
jgi:hypothetical protein